jgi:4-amino-4-deoxy-L-arabinose transferase-like glycosyltransferase
MDRLAEMDRVADMDTVQGDPSAFHVRQTSALFICIALAALAISIDAGASKLSQIYDEGVYWQSLRAMSAGYHLYEEIFYSQPPVFLLSVYPFYQLFGATVASARLGVISLSLLGIPGAYLMGTALAGRVGGIAAAVLLAITPMYFQQAHILEAEGPAIGLLFLTIGAAFMWWERPTGRSGVAFAMVCAVSLALGILTKLLDVTAVVPILLLVLARIWNIRHEDSHTVWRSILPIAAAVFAGAIATFFVLAPFLHASDALWQQVVMFHLAAKRELITSQGGNIDTLADFFIVNRALAAAAMVSVAVAVMGRDWRILPLLGWFLVTLILVSIQVPLWPRHAIVLIPPLIGLVALGLKNLPAITLRGPITWTRAGTVLMGLVVLAVVVSDVRREYHRYKSLQSARSTMPWTEEVAADLARLTTPDQWTVTDAQFVAALAKRDTPPWLVDTSFTRISSGYLTLNELIQAASDPRVRAVVFATDHFTLPPVAAFRPWVQNHFNLARTYGPGIELWTR